MRATIERDGLLADLEAIGATVLANACGPCIGQWQRDDIQTGERNTIVIVVQPQLPGPQRRQRGHALRSSARPRRSPRMALTGRLDVDFVREPIADARRQRSAARPRRRPTSCRRKGFDPGESGFVAPAADAVGASRSWSRPDSDRLELLEPFPAWDGNDFTGMQVLMKAVGKCTTDHISPAGHVAAFRGHLTNISGNLFIGREQRVRPRPRRARASTSRDGSTVAAARSRQALQGRRHRVGGDRRRELRRRLVP